MISRVFSKMACSGYSDIPSITQSVNSFSGVVFCCFNPSRSFFPSFAWI